MTAAPAPDQGRRLAAERNNERVQPIATSLNAIALAILGAAFVVPALANPVIRLSPGPWISRFVALVPHFVAHAMLQLLRSEE